MKLLIVGGGTAGWMTASYLARAFDHVDITLVESGTVRTVGVGEATFSTVKLFFDFLGLQEREWMPHCSAAYKLAIRFQNWTKAKTHFYHPFERLETAGGMSAAEWWLKLRNGEPFDYSCFVTPHICDAMRSPKFLDGTIYDDKVSDYFDESKPAPNAMIAGHEVQYPYAYHFNAAELAAYLQGYAMSRGVKRVVDDVLEVELNEQGAIAGVHTRDSGFLSADLFVDCTGFRGLLLNKALNEPFISFNDTLLNDSAVAIQVPRDIEKEGMKPYTTAHALNAGWAWNIPLYGRDGTGYVYCSQFATPEEAEREFREFLGPDAKDCEPNHIQMRIGRSRNTPPAARVPVLEKGAGSKGDLEQLGRINPDPYPEFLVNFALLRQAAIARQHRVDAVVADQCDYSLFASAVIADLLGLRLDLSCHGAAAGSRHGADRPRHAQTGGLPARGCHAPAGRRRACPRRRRARAPTRPGVRPRPAAAPRPRPPGARR